MFVGSLRVLWVTSFVIVSCARESRGPSARVRCGIAWAPCVYPYLYATVWLQCGSAAVPWRAACLCIVCLCNQASFAGDAVYPGLLCAWVSQVNLISAWSGRGSPSVMYCGFYSRCGIRRQVNRITFISTI